MGSQQEIPTGLYSYLSLKNLGELDNSSPPTNSRESTGTVEREPLFEGYEESLSSLSVSFDHFSKMMRSQGDNNETITFGLERDSHPRSNAVDEQTKSELAVNEIALDKRKEFSLEDTLQSFRQEIDAKVRY